MRMSILPEGPGAESEGFVTEPPPTSGVAADGRLELSIVIPTFHRPGLVTETLGALAGQETQARFEVIVAIDGHEPDTRRTLGELALPYALRVIEQDHAGAGAARNAGAAIARGDLLLFLDDDIRPSPVLVEEHLRAQRDFGPMVGIGRLTFTAIHARAALIRYLADWWVRHDAKLTADPQSADARDAFSGNLCLPRDWFLEAGGYATDIARPDDVELGVRLAARGRAFRYVADASGEQTYDRTPAQLLRDAYLQGRGEVEVYRRHPHALPSLWLGTFGAGARLSVLEGWLRPQTMRLEPLWRLVDAILEHTRPSTRWLRWRYSGAFWAGVRAAAPDLWQRLVNPPVVLMYHAFTENDAGESRYVISRRRFRQHMRWIRRRRYPVLTAAELAGYRARGEVPPAGAVVVTIDDGFESAVEHGLPILRDCRINASLFIPTRLLGGEFEDRRVMTAERLAAVAQAGFEVEAHSRTHADLTGTSSEQTEAEVAGSRHDLAGLFGADPTAFAYPYGHENQVVQEVARSAGFRAAFTTYPRPVAPIHGDLALPRYEIPGGFPFLRFAILLWLRLPRVGWLH